MFLLCSSVVAFSAMKGWLSSALHFYVKNILVFIKNVLKELWLVFKHHH